MDNLQLAPSSWSYARHINSTISLDFSDVILSDGILNLDRVGKKTSRFFIAEAIQRLHADAVNKSIFAGRSEKFPEFPAIEQLSVSKTQFWQLTGITADEGTITGAYTVNDDILLNQLKLQKC